MDTMTVLDRLASRFRALGAEKRLRILASLSGGERCACDLTGCCGDRQPLLSFHLKTLREAGLVRARREGRWMYYEVNREALRELGEQLTRIGELDARERDCCDSNAGDESARVVEAAGSGHANQRSDAGR